MRLSLGTPAEPKSRGPRFLRESEGRALTSTFAPQEASVRSVLFQIPPAPPAPPGLLQSPGSGGARPPLWQDHLLSGPGVASLGIRSPAATEPLLGPRRAARRRHGPASLTQQLCKPAGSQGASLAPVAPSAPATRSGNGQRPGLSALAPTVPEASHLPAPSAPRARGPSRPFGAVDSCAASSAGCPSPPHPPEPKPSRGATSQHKSVAGPTQRTALSPGVTLKREPRTQTRLPKGRGGDSRLRGTGPGPHVQPSCSQRAGWSHRPG